MSLTPMLFKCRLYFLIFLVTSPLTHGLFRSFFFFHVGIYSYKFPLGTALAVPTSFVWLVVFPFSFLFCYFPSDFFHPLVV